LKLLVAPATFRLAIAPFPNRWHTDVWCMMAIVYFMYSNIMIQSST